jgi:RNase P subunit RPR2
MFCQRCRGLLVRETFDDMSIRTDSLHTATRCINCGCIEDAVVRANRFGPSVKTRMIPRGKTRRGNVDRIKIHSEEYASMR